MGGRLGGWRPGLGLQVLVLGTPDQALVDALWGMGLRPVRGQRSGCLWVRPGEVMA